eukprot:m.162516 g.162516  ORF g.162516 m.162516 type:complete len:328 (+) comp12204_c0_seq1:100-1083(+)
MKEREKLKASIHPHPLTTERASKRVGPSTYWLAHSTPGPPRPPMPMRGPSSSSYAEPMPLPEKGPEPGPRSRSWSKSSSSQSSASAGRSGWVGYGKSFRNAMAVASSMLPSSGNATWKMTNRRPFSNGERYLGIPSPEIILTSSCLTTLPGGDEMTTLRPSRCLMTRWNPVRASPRLMSIFVMRSIPWRLNSNPGLGRSRTINTTSPVVLPYSSSALPWRVMRCPSSMPLSTLASIVSFFRTRPCRQPRSWHWSLRATYWPEPPHFVHSTCTCCTNPGPRRRYCTSDPCPLHVSHVDLPALGLVEPVPLHAEHRMFRLMASFLTLPL